MNKSLILQKVTVIVLLSLCVSGCKMNEKYKVPSDSLTESPVLTPSIAAVNTPVPSAEPLASDIEYEASEVIRYVKGNRVNLRESSGLDSDIILSLNDSTKVEILDIDGTWSKVKYEDKIGYIRNDYLSATTPVPEINSDAVATTENNMPDKLSSPAIIVKKSERILELWDGDKLFDSYPIGLGWEPIGDKKVEGDGRTPEGTYYVCTRNNYSRFYLSLGVSYPNVEDAKEALDAGVIDRSTNEQIVNAINGQDCPPWKTALGGEIMIHGMGSSSDWTAGCVAVDNNVMDILWKYCPLKTPITIKP